MKSEGIRTKIRDIINDRYMFDDNAAFTDDLLSRSAENLKHKEIIRIKRSSTEVDIVKAK
jgi:hypothetical protein